MADEKLASSAPESAHLSRPEEVAAIPLMEERLSITKRAVESGRVRVHITVEEDEQKITEELCRNDVHIERVPKNIHIAEAPHVRIEGNTTIIPVVEEVVVVEKRLMLVEEVHISRRSVTEPTEIPVKVRRERATVERGQAAPADTQRE
jgi:uncharacterized protein (TIGR02271 family)